MSKSLIIIGSVIGVIAIFVFVVIANVVGWSNTEVRTKNSVLAQQKSNEATFDKVWKVISQEAQVTDNYKESFRSIYSDIMSNRYGADKKSNPMFKWIQESNPQLSETVFTKLMTAIEANRDEFLNEQKRLVDLNREHDNLIQQFPGSLYASILGRQSIQITVVTSTKTEQAFKTGKEDDVNLSH